MAQKVSEERLAWCNRMAQNGAYFRHSYTLDIIADLRDARQRITDLEQQLAEAWLEEDERE